MLLIDTYNVLQTSGILPPDLSGLDAPALADLIAASRYADRPVKLVCDGARAAPAPRRPGVEFLFAGPGAEADDLIERIIRANSAPRRLLVVSSDRRILAAARRRRAPTLTSDKFLAHLSADRDRPTRRAPPAFTHDLPLDAYSVAHWMREFGLDTGGNADKSGTRPAERAPAHAQPASIVQPNPQTPKPARRTPPIPAAASPPPDPLLIAAQKEWPGGIQADDLDMRKWLSDPRHIPRPSIPPRGRGRRAGA